MSRALLHPAVICYSEITITAYSKTGDDPVIRPVVWVGSSLKDMREFPEPVQDHMGYAIYVAQSGGKHRNAKPLTGYGGAGAVEVVSGYRGDTFRAVYTVLFAGTLYVLHAFQKKSKTGRETTKSDIELIGIRLREAERIAKNTTEIK